MKTIVLLPILLSFMPASHLRADAPKLTSSSPPLWGVGVNSAVQKTISLTFDQRMSPAYTAWLGRSSLPPPDLDMNSSMSQDRLTFSTKARLEAGKVYVLALNEKNIDGVGFQNEKGASLAPTYLVFQTAGAPKPEDAPPIVLKSLPANGEQQVDPARTKAIVLSFDKPMQTAKQGLHLFENNTAIDISKARFGYSADGRTFTLYYDFKASTPYRMELNSVTDIGFASAKRVPLWPVQIGFTTVQPR